MKVLRPGDKVMNKKTYRIIHNGVMYRVEVLKIEHFLWWTRERWISYWHEFDAIEEAEKFVEAKQMIHGWAEVKRFKS